MKSYSEMESEGLAHVGVLNQNYSKAYNYYKVVFKDDYLPQKLQGKKETKYSNSELTIDRSEYYFYEFETWDIGKPVALNKEHYQIVERVSFNYCIFKDCNIHNIVFRRCDFSGSKFQNVDFRWVVFEDCIFSIPVLERDCDISKDIYYAPAIFSQCYFIADFLKCKLESSLFAFSNFTSSKFQNTSLQNSVMDKCALSDIHMQDCNLNDFVITNTDIMGIDICDKQLSSVNENTFIDFKIATTRKNVGERNISGWKASSYEDLFLKKSKTLNAFSKLYTDNGYSDLGGEYFFRSKSLERTCFLGLEKLKSWVGFLLCGYGERPSYTFLLIFVSTLLFAVFYMFSGISTADDYINYNIGGSTPILRVLSDYAQCVFFSVTTFSTVGYGNYVPVGSVSMLLSAIHMFIGVSLCALWTGCIFRKIAR